MLLGDYIFSNTHGIIDGTTSTKDTFGAATGVTFSLTKNTTNAEVWMYKGSLPSAIEMDNFVGGSRASDVLLKITATVSSDTTNMMRLSGQSLAIVVQTGTIGWLCIGAQNDATANKALLFCSVGLTGSGADLILPKIAVVANDNWSCNIKIHLNSNYSQQ